MAKPLTSEDLSRIDRYWRAANYLSVGQIYLRQNPLLREPLRPEHVKPRLLGHWGTTPGLNFIYVHLNRLIRERGLKVLSVTGPGARRPRHRREHVSRRLVLRVISGCRGGGGRDPEAVHPVLLARRIPSHAAPETPGSIHEGGELGYVLLHGYGAVFDNPDLIACCVVGDGEAETGPCATSWHSNKFLNPVRDGAVLPILHLNGYKIAGPTVLARLPEEELRALLVGYGHEPFFVEGHEPEPMHRLMAETLDRVADRISAIQTSARSHGYQERERWPMIVLRTPKGWTGPKVVDGKPVEGTFRSHQVPVANPRRNPEHLRILEVLRIPARVRDRDLV